MVDEHGILKQCRIENEALGHTRDALLAMIAWPVEGTLFTRKLSGLRFLARWFQQQVERLFAIEEYDGYMDLAIESAPHFADRIKALQAEHSTLEDRLSAIMTRLERMLPDDSNSFDQVCQDLTLVVKELDAHMQREVSLVQEVATQDIGGEGGG